ncbi:MAG: hypothetical protein IPM91_09690 [Bacteroidetes bacterium]|nr:hypothetical protein [Bacteroidota bacterium]
MYILKLQNSNGTAREKFVKQ